MVKCSEDYGYNSLRCYQQIRGSAGDLFIIRSLTMPSQLLHQSVQLVGQFSQLNAKVSWADCIGNIGLAHVASRED